MGERHYILTQKTIQTLSTAKSIGEVFCILKDRSKAKFARLS